MLGVDMEKLDKLSEILEECLNEQLVLIVLSHIRNKKSDLKKIKIRPVLIKKDILFQVTYYVGNQVTHQNIGKEQTKADILSKMTSDFVQLEIEYVEFDATVLVGKKLDVSIKKRLKNRNDSKDQNGQNGRNAVNTPYSILSHNRQKKYILEEGVALPFLIDLSVMNKDGMIVKKNYDKFRQINRFLEFIEDILEALPRDREVRIVDFGCGKSYLTFAMYYYLRVKRGYDVRITGLDLKTDVIRKCNSLRDKYGYDKLDFQYGDIKDYEGDDSADMVVTLHACDTATDYALYKAVKWGASVILSVPCCQHEINAGIDSEILSPVLKYGIIKERMSALLTDGIRGEVLKTQGYDVSLLEFIDMEHTPKNILIRAVKTKNRKFTDTEASALDVLIKEIDVEPLIVRLFNK